MWIWEFRHLLFLFYIPLPVRGVDNTQIKGGYLGTTVSYRNGNAEFFFTPRYNTLTWDTSTSTLNEGDDIFGLFKNVADEVDFNYYQINIGASYWFSDRFSIDSSVICLEVDSIMNCAVPMIGLGWKF